MNKAYRLIWNKAKERWIVAAETIKGNGGIPPTTVAAAAVISAILALGATVAHALPSGGQVAAGAATISTPSASQMNINQSSAQAIINWNSFGIGKGEAVNIAQPTAQSTLLNRVLGNDPSHIFGSLTANGKVFLVNPSGILFAPGANVNVGGLVASTLNIKDSDFLVGKYSFFKDGSAGSVVNQGKISGGFVALLGSTVENAGTIVTTKGSTGLAAGDEITLGFDPYGMMAIKVDKAAYAAQISNSGVIEADGGTVVMTASAADVLLATVVNNTGTIRANSMVERNGQIVIEANTVTNSGSLEAKGITGTGGRITIEGDSITLASGSSIDTSGEAGGGTVLIGGGWQGSGGLHQATTVTMEQGAKIDVSATKVGAGGTAVLWSDVHKDGSVTNVAGEIRAEGAGENSAAGQVETSGHKLTIANTTSVKTGGGQWLLDPYDFTVGTDITGAALGTALDSGNVSITTAAGSATCTGVTCGAGNISGNGDIFVNDSVSWSANNTLTLSAWRNIEINNSIVSSGASGKLILEYGQSAVAAGNTAAYKFGTGGKADLQPGANFTTKLGSDGAAVNFTVIAAGTTPFTNNSMNNSSGKFAIGADVDFTAVGAKSGGFISQNAAGFILEGLGHALSNISVTPTWAYQGMFGYNYGTIRNLNITNLTLSTTTYQSLGFVGMNMGSGLVDRIRVSGSNTISGDTGVGVIVGTNDGGTVSNFSISGSIVTSSPASGAAVGVNQMGSASGYTVPGVVTNGTSSASITASGLTSYTWVNGRNPRIGGIIGWNWGTASNLTNSGSITIGDLTGNPSTTQQSGIGGIVGENGYASQAYPAIVSNSIFSGNITFGSNAQLVGGIAGFNHSTISGSTSSGTITTTSGARYIGGIAGKNEDPWGPVASIQGNSKFTGTITTGTSSQYVAGITGYNPETVTATDSNGIISTGSSSTYVGGIIGYNLAGGTISSSSSSSAVSIGGTTASVAVGTVSPYLGKLIGFNGGTSTSNTYLTPITVSTLPLSLTYGYSGTPSYSYSLINGTLTGGDTLGTVLSGSPLCSSCTNAGTYSVLVGTTTAISSYRLIWQSGSLTVDKASLTVTANNDSKTYSGTAYSGGNGVAYSGFVNSETSVVLGGALAYGGTSQGAVTAGSYTIIPSGLTATNYILSFVNGTLAITGSPALTPAPPSLAQEVLPPSTPTPPPAAAPNAGPTQPPVLPETTGTSTGGGSNTPTNSDNPTGTGTTGTGGFTGSRELGMKQVVSTDFIYQISDNVFEHSNPKASIQLNARLENGSPLPSWISFNPSRKTISGKPPEGLRGEFNVVIIARDQFGNEARTTLKIRVGK
jgi:filamentous hemagglutinin family protein